MTETTTLLDIDSILDSQLDAVADLPDYLTPPTGTYVLNVIDAEIKPGKKAEAGKEAKAARIVITYSVAATKETDSTMPVPDGSLFNEGFQGTEKGLEFFKKQAKKLLNVEDLNGVTIRDILASLKEVQNFDAIVTVKQTKGDQGQDYENINVRPVWGN